MLSGRTSVLDMAFPPTDQAKLMMLWPAAVQNGT